MSVGSTRHSKGFTLVEFMISTALFSLILVVVLSAISQVSKLYSKGVTTSRTQQTTRTILETISQQIQYSEGVPTPTTGISTTTDGELGVICIGSRRFSYAINRQVDGGTPNTDLKTQRHALWVDQTPAGACTAVAAADMANTDTPAGSVNGEEFLPEGMRLTYLEISPVASTTAWKIKVGVAFGVQDLLETRTTGQAQQDAPRDTICKGSQIGTQFCAVSELETLVQRRVQ